MLRLSLTTVLAWCPSCQISIGEVSLPNYEMEFGAKPFDMNPFLTFLAAHAERLAGLMKRRVERRIALHERPVFPEVTVAVKKLLSIVPGAELVEIDVPRVGTQANSLAQLPKFKRELVERELRAVADAGVTTLATIYHACHREICDAGEGRSFEVVNFMELLGEAINREGQIPPANNHIPASTPCVTEELWRGYCYAGAVSSGNQEAKRQAFKRAAEAHVAAGRRRRGRIVCAGAGVDPGAAERSRQGRVRAACAQSGWRTTGRRLAVASSRRRTGVV
jgi:hypothetical protein